MSIIVEGVDGIGKTYFANEWCSIYKDYCYIHNFTKPKTKADCDSETTKELLLLANMSNNIVFDRSFIMSEYVYAQVMNRTQYINEEFMHTYVKMLNTYHHSVVLFIYKNINVLSIKDEDKLLPFDKLNNLYYELFVEKFKIGRLDVRYVETARGR